MIFDLICYCHCQGSSSTLTLYQESLEMSSDIYQKALNRALKLLKIRLHTTFELARKLKIRGFKPEIVERVIEELSQQGLVNDQSFAQVYLDNLMRYKTFGFYGLKAKLMQRGIDVKVADGLLNENLSLEQEAKIAERWLEKRRETDKVKLAQSLSRKGFRTEVIRSVLRDFLLKQKPPTLAV